MHLQNRVCFLRLIDSSGERCDGTAVDRHWRIGGTSVYKIARPSDSDRVCGEVDVHTRGTPMVPGCEVFGCNPSQHLSGTS